MIMLRRRDHSHRLGAVLLVALVVLGSSGCGGDAELPTTEVVSEGTRAGTTGGTEPPGAVAATSPGCRTPGPLPADASDALTRLHAAAVDLAASADAMRALALDGSAPTAWPGNPADSLVLRRFLEDLYRTASIAEELSTDPAVEAALVEAVQSLLALQAGDLPRLYQAQSAEDAAGPVDAICATVDRFADAVDAIGGVQPDR